MAPEQGAFQLINKGGREMRALLFAGVVLLLSCLPVFAQSSGEAPGKGCNANPRWILVTVVDREYYTKEDGILKKTEVLSWSSPKGDFVLVDRCEVTSITSIYDARRRGFSKDAIKYKSEIYTDSGGLEVFRVKESLQDLCRAMKDCVDATLKERVVSRLEYLLEAERRGILPQDMAKDLQEARRRGLVPPARQASKE